VPIRCGRILSGGGNFLGGPGTNWSCRDGDTRRVEICFLFELARFRLNDILAGTFGLIEDHYGVL